MSNVVPFSFHQHQVRILPEGDTFWAVAKDVSDILGYRDADAGTRVVPVPHKGTKPIRTPGGTQQMICVDEPGLYRMILRSDKPEAEPFMEWVTAEVLPAVRRTGAYVHPQVEAPAPVGLTPDQYAAEIAGLTARLAKLRSTPVVITGQEYDRLCQAARPADPARDLTAKHYHVPLSQTQRTEIGELFAAGHNKSAIARHVGCSQSTVRRTLADLSRGVA